MSGWQEVVGERLDEPDREAVLGWLRAYNHERSPGFFTRRDLPEHAPRPLVVLLRGQDGEPLAGLLGLTQFHRLVIEIMAAAPERRRRGLGRRLVALAEAEASARGCRNAFVDTMSYQAPGFYESLGYELVGRLRDWDSHGHDKLFFAKRLFARDPTRA